MGKTRTPLGNFIHSSWTNMNIRAGKYRHLQTKSKCYTYNNISIDFTREEYKNYCFENQEIILNLKRPSLDRINNDANYSLSNIRIIELSENIRKDKTKFKDGYGVCRRCTKQKLEEDFVKDKRTFSGRTTICKECVNVRKK